MTSAWNRDYLLCLVHLAFCVLGTVGHALGQGRTFVILGAEQGLAHHEVYQVSRDATGGLWIATRGGLHRWRGERTIETTLTSSNSALTLDFIVGIESFQAGLVIGTSGGGVYSLSPQVGLTPVTVREDCRAGTGSSTENLYVRALHGAADGSVLLGTTGRGVWRYTQSGLCRLTTPDLEDAARLRSTWALTTGELGQVWLGTMAGGLFSAELNGDQLGTLDSLQLPNGRIRDLEFDENGDLWIATSGAGVLRYSFLDSAHVRVSTVTTDGSRLPENRATAIQFYGDKVWIGTWGGLSVFDQSTKQFTTYRHQPDDPTSLCNDVVNTIYLDRYGILWLGTDDGLCGLPATTHGATTLAAPQGVTGISADHDGNRLFVGSGRGIHEYSTGEGWSDYPLPVISSRSREVIPQSFLPTAKGVLVGTGQSGLFLYEGGTYRRISFGEGSEGGRAISGLHRTGDESILVSTVGGGVTRLDGASLDSTAAWNVFGTRSSRASVLSADGMLWLAANTGGVYSLDPRSGFVQKADPWADEERDLVFDRVEDLAIDGDGGIWAATTGGVIYYHPTNDSVRHFSRLDGLPATSIVAVEWDSVGSAVWIASDRALSHLDVATGRWTTRRPTRISKGGRFLPRGLVAAQGRILAAREEEVWEVSASHGPLSPKPAVTFEADGLELRDSTVTLPRGRTDFHLEVVLAELIWPEAVRIEVQLEDYEQQPHVIDGTVFRYPYTNVDTRGEPYSLAIVVIAANGQVHHLNYAIRIRPFIWETTWFRVSTILLLVLAAARGITLWASRKKREAIEIQTALAESREDERSLLARHIHDDPLQSLYTLRHQLELLELTEGQEGAEKVVSLTGGAIDALRRICGELRPKTIGTVDLDRTVASKCSSFGEENPEILVDTSLEPVGALPERIVIALYRILQSALANVARHSEAEAVTVTLGLSDEHVVLTVEDDGIGFEKDTSMISLARGRHFGLLGMYEWARQVGGELIIRSEPGTGTTLMFRVPKPVE